MTANKHFKRRVRARAAARLDCAQHDAGRVWAVRQYIVIRDADRFVLGCGSGIPAADDPLFTALAEGFELLDPA